MFAQAERTAALPFLCRNTVENRKAPVMVGKKYLARRLRRLALTAARQCGRRRQRTYGIMMEFQPGMYRFLTGPGLWATFIIFFGGLSARMAYLYHLSRKKDRVIYNHASFSWGIKSILYWLLPWGSASMRQQPVFTFMVFIFHITLLAAPVFLYAHNILWDEAWGISMWSLPDSLTDAMTVMLLASIVFLIIRRVVRREVRILTEPRDFALLVITALPFLTGFLAYHQFEPYELWMIMHILTGEILLILIPFTKLGHMVLFFFTRAFIGFEMGGRRGARSW